MEQRNEAVKMTKRCQCQSPGAVDWLLAIVCPAWRINGDFREDPGDGKTTLTNSCCRIYKNWINDVSRQNHVMCIGQTENGAGEYSKRQT